AFASNWLLPLAALFTALFTAFKLDNAMLEREFMTQTSYGFLFKPWRFFIRWIVPSAIILIVLQHADVINVNALTGK
ncbi:MAG TPA: hypothetical protein VN457_06485, partial [Chlamydiales bacterium]|nr:hypothetical protein [Chlamydiales bacterium]